jgi:hypothetical protein
MGERDELGSVLAPGADGRGERALAATAEEVTLRVPADEQRQFDAGQAG